MRLLLDTHILIVAAVEGLEALGARARKALRDSAGQCFLSAVSISEIAIKSNIGKLTITGDQVERAIQDIRLATLPYTPNHALRLFDLPLHHGDPFDRMLIATALAEDLPILSADAAFSRYSGLQVIKA